MASPAFKINGGAAGVKASIAAGGAVTAILDSTVGVRLVAWSIVRTDETSTPASYVLVQSGGVGQQVDTTALGAGTSAALQCIINGGIDAATDAPSTAMTSVGKFYVPVAGTYEVLNGGELEDDSRESSATHGAVDPLNKVIRALATTAGAYKDPVRAATAAALAVYTRVGNVITADANGIMAAVDGVTLVAGEDMLMKNGAAGADNGPYTVTSVGTAGTPFVLTRRGDADTTGKLVGGAIVPVAEGTVNGDQLFILATNDTITINTTAQTWTNWGALAPLVTGAARGEVVPFGAGTPVLTSDGATAGGVWATIVDANVAGGAAIAGSKVNPAFGAQNISTTGGCQSGWFNAPPSSKSLTASVNDWNGASSPAASFVRVTTDAAGYSITGIVAAGNGHVLVISNVNAADLFTLSHDSGASAEANRMLLSGAGAQTLTAGTSVTLIYDSTTTRWRQIAPVT